MAEGAMATFLTTMTDFYTWVLTSLGSAYETIISNPGLTVVCLAIPIAFVVPRFLNSLFRVN